MGPTELEPLAFYPWKLGKKSINYPFMFAPDEILDIQDQAKGEMRSTPYVVDDDQLEISFKRTSKVKYYRWSFLSIYKKK